MEGKPKGFSTSELAAIERLLYLSLELQWPRGFSISIWMEGNQWASLPRNLRWLRGFFTSIWMEGNQGSSLPRNLGRLRRFSISILNCGNQGASLPRSWMEGNQVASLPWNLGWLRGFSISIFELWQPRDFSTSIFGMVTKGLLYFGTWVFAYKRLKFETGLLMISALLFHCIEMYDLPFSFLDLIYLNFP